MTDPMDNLRQSSADVSGVEVLSPAAQAVWDAAWQLSPVNCESHEDRRRQQIAVALRAVADQVVPSEPPVSGGVRPGGTGAVTLDEAQQFQCSSTRRHILAIADELDATYSN